MVCVTVQKTCKRLIQAGFEKADGGTLRVVHVVKPGAKVLGGGNDSEALEYLFQSAREAGAQMDMLRSDDVIGTMVEFAKAHAVECVVLGAAGGRQGLGVAQQMERRLPGVELVVVP